MGGTIEAFRWAVDIDAKEAAFGTALPTVGMTDWLAINDAGFAKIDKRFRTDENRIKGTRGIQTRQLARRMGSIPFKSDASIEKLIWLLYRGLGNGTVTGASDPYSHTLKRPSMCTLYPPSISLMQGIVCAGLTSGYKLFTGVTLDNFSLSMDGDGPLELSWSDKTDGREVTQSSFSWPSAPSAENYLLGSHCSLKLYPNGGSVIDITSQLLGFKLNYNFNVQETKQINNGVYVPKYRYSKGHPKLEFEFTVSADKSDAIYGYSDAETLLTAELLLDTGLTPARSAKMTVNKCYIQAEQGADDIEPTLVCKIDLIDVIADNGPEVWLCKNGQASYLNPL